MVYSSKRWRLTGGAVHSEKLNIHVRCITGWTRSAAERQTPRLGRFNIYYLLTDNHRSLRAPLFRAGLVSLFSPRVSEVDARRPINHAARMDR